MLNPVRHAPPPAYPGAAPQRRFCRTLALFLHGQVSLPICVFLVLSAAQGCADEVAARLHAAGNPLFHERFYRK